ncbi:CmpA/NrtA family ABC transporter substrate-binding protein [Leptolyngbya sp. NIES-2104]|uniref:CmpA/NrtA family ABC transporter substrate-binding protein n=1 Tax=Leptolyngbya sp. NIES-2104 TaxID=1552121 RepID=UPI0006ECC997|nr:CmpA/NrtA family ABC transporter substrate-binding protein [Leptolyngbya sp. NIES-2104]GAP96753.1 bicarbonate transporter, bicarbonate binding protein [Leptolyngbya sp. NIES-2104]
MTEFNFLTRRKFLWTASAAAGAVTLKGCAINPPSPSDLSPKAQALSLSPAELPETARIKLGYIAIAESAPLIIAKEKGFFARHGMSDVEISKQPSWGAARDNAELGSANGGIDGGQWQMPMPHLLSEGLITKGNRKIPMVVLAQLCTHGNGVAVANTHTGKGFELNLAKSGAADYIRELKQRGIPFRAAYTFPKANQDFWIRYWMAANGVDPNTEINLMAVPSAQTVANMKTGTMDAFSTGDPWPYRIVRDGVGFLAVLTAQVWQYHPEEYLAVRREWIEKNPKATKAVLKAVMEAQQWCDKAENKEELSRILAQRKYFNVPPNFLRGPYAGEYQLGDTKRTENNPELAVKYWKDGRGSVSYPYKSHDLWFLTESVRWGFLPQGALGEADRIVNEVNGEKFWREAAQELGLAQSDIPQQTTRGVEKFFDGAEFDPTKPQAYLDSLKFKSLKA